MIKSRKDCVATTGTRLGRAKLSTTVSRDTYQYLEQKVASGQAATIAEAVDRSILTVRQLENRERLALATASYFDHLEPRAAAEENSLARDLASAGAEIDFDQEL